MLNEIIDSPLDDYAKKFKNEHTKNIDEFLDSLVKTAGTDVDANIKTVKKIRKTESELENQNRRRKRLNIFRTIIIILLIMSIAAGALSITNMVQLKSVEKVSMFVVLGSVGILCLTIFGIIKLNKSIKNSDAYILKLQGIIKELMDEAWAQMASLNQAFDWDMPRRIMQKTLPLVKLDKHYTNKKQLEMQRIYNMVESFGNECSVTHQQSGSIKNNPFVLFQYKEFQKGQKAYFGFLNIQWTEQQRTKDGVRTVVRTQTLNASLNAFYPEYSSHAGIVYFHEAAPDLSFERLPQKANTMDDKQTERYIKSQNKKIDKIAEKSVTQGKSFTAMSNPRFDPLFGALNRNHEVQFRLLYTPVAQKETLKLIEDKKEGFGDNFVFRKTGRMNIVEPYHLSQMDLSTNPTRYMSYEYEKSKKIFTQFNHEYFKALYFSLAPILAIPQYQQNSGISLDEKEMPHGFKLSEFEHEEIVNQMDIKHLRHQDSVRDDILKIRKITTTKNTDILEVSAHGYAAHQRVSFVSVRGGDGFIHNVPVPWVEYLPVVKKTNIAIRVIDELNRSKYMSSLKNRDLWNQIFKDTEKSYDHMIFAKNTIAYITNNIGEISDEIISKLYK